MKTLYLLVDIGAFIVPFIFSFYPTIQFYKKWNAALPAIFITAAFFIAWDVLYTQKGIWGFNPYYLTGFYFFNLPIEEVLFFICIPYSCLFTYYSLKRLLFRSENTTRRTILITDIAAGVLIVVAMLFYKRLYTSVSFLFLALCLLYAVRYSKETFRRFMLTNAILIFPFIIVNGILTGTGIDNEVVWYNNDHNLGLRILTIPIEDFFYGTLLILINMVLFEKLCKKQTSYSTENQ